METEEPSFSWLVVKKTWKGTLETFETTVHAMSLAAAIIFASLATQYLRFGFEEMRADLFKTFWESVWPVFAVGSAVALWNFWLAPSALAYEAAKGCEKKNVAEPAPSLRYGETTRLDWTPWKLMPSFGVTQFAKIIAKEDPYAPSISTAAASYRQLIFSAVKGKTLPYIPTYFESGGRKIEHSLDEGKTHIARDEAIKWAKTKSLPIDHIE